MNQTINKAIVIVAVLSTCMLSSVFAKPLGEIIAGAEIVQVTGTPHKDMKVDGTSSLQWFAPGDTGGGYGNLLQFKHLLINENGTLGRISHTKVPGSLKLKFNNKEFTEHMRQGLPLTDEIMKKAKSLAKKDGKRAPISLKLHLYEDEQGQYKYYHNRTDHDGFLKGTFVGSFDLLLADDLDVRIAAVKRDVQMLRKHVSSISLVIKKLPE